MAERAGSGVGSARRSRQRRLRSMLKHERQTVATEPAAALHLSRDVGPVLHDALRGQKTASSVGKRPAPLAEVAGLQEATATVVYVAAAGAPLLVPARRFVSCSSWWNWPVAAQRQGYGQTVQETVLVPQVCSPSKVVDFPVVPQNQISTVLPVRKTIETPQLQCVVWWSMPLLCRSCLPCPLLSMTGAQGSDSAEFRGQLQFLHAARSSRQSWRCLRLAHRRDVQVLRRGDFAAFCCIFRTPSAWT